MAGRSSSFFAGAGAEAPASPMEPTLSFGLYFFRTPSLWYYDLLETITSRTWVKYLPELVEVSKIQNAGNVGKYLFRSIFSSNTNQDLLSSWMFIKTVFSLSDKFLMQQGQEQGRSYKLDIS